MQTITALLATPLSLPLNEPFRVAARTAYEARNVLLRIWADDGSVGLGAAAPVEYVSGETPESVLQTAADAADGLIGQSTQNIAALLNLVHEMAPAQPAARAALEMALLDLAFTRTGIPLWKHFGAAQTEIISDLTIPIVAPDVAFQKARQAWSDGFRHLKIKVGDPDGVEADRARLASVSAAAPGAALRIDANQAFSPDAALEFIKWSAATCPMVELVEQPVPKLDFAGLAYVRARLDGGPPIFADESVQTEDSASELIRLNAVDGFNLKIMKSGLDGVLRIGSLARRNGIKLMIGCMLESRLSLSAACAVAAGTGWFEYIDIDAHHLLRASTVFEGGFDGDGCKLTPEMVQPGWGVRLCPAMAGGNNSS